MKICAFRGDSRRANTSPVRASFSLGFMGTGLRGFLGVALVGAFFSVCLPHGAIAQSTDIELEQRLDGLPLGECSYSQVRGLVLAVVHRRPAKAAEYFRTGLSRIPADHTGCDLVLAIDVARVVKQSHLPKVRKDHIQARIFGSLGSPDAISVKPI
jgi:hypothetical protein